VFIGISAHMCISICVCIVFLKKSMLFFLSSRLRKVRKLAEPSRLRVGTWNVGSLTSKLREIVDTMIRRHVNILCVHETKWKGRRRR
jgi:hypothetical protein